MPSIFLHQKLLEIFLKVIGVPSVQGATNHKKSLGKNILKFKLVISVILLN